MLRFRAAGLLTYRAAGPATAAFCPPIVPERIKDRPLQNPSCGFPLNDSMYPFSYGLPGSM